eukprot:2264148-Pyramimonas_sp.AAC.1
MLLGFAPVAVYMCRPGELWLDRPYEARRGGSKYAHSASSYTCLSRCLPCHTLTLRRCSAAVCDYRTEKERAGLRARAEGSFPRRRRVVGQPAPSLPIPECNCLAVACSFIDVSSGIVYY